MVMIMLLLKKLESSHHRHTQYIPLFPSVIYHLIGAQLLHLLLYVLTTFGIIIIIKIESLGDGPFAELVKQDYTTLVEVNVSELSLCILDGSNPFLHELLGSGEFLQIDPPVVISINSAESDKVLEVLSE